MLRKKKKKSRELKDGAQQEPCSKADPTPHLEEFWAAENQLLHASYWCSNTLVLGISQHAFLIRILTNK